MDKVGCDMICKSHSARSEREQYRICPTKLTKAELENLYFVLLENNLELKKTVNGQQDKIKVLSTKVQRITSAQKVLRAEEKKDCCVATKLTVNQQKELISDLKRSNERMAERIRKLNMRLCSAKQFCKTTTPRCLRCSSATSPYLIKHSPSSYKHQSQSTLKFAVSCHNLSREAMITKCVQTDFCEVAKQTDKKPCEDNKCRTVLEELKQKIINLQEELSRTQNESSSRINALESELQQSHAENVRVRSERVAAEHELGHKENRIAQLVTGLRAAEGLSSELKTQLSIEKRKVAELETRLKAATMSNRMTQTIEDTLTSIQESSKSTAVDVTLTCACSPRCHTTEPYLQETSIGVSVKDRSYCDDTKLSKSIDDSGFVEANKSQPLLDDQSLNKIIEELTNRIVVLQTQVDALTISPPVESYESKSKTIEKEVTVVKDHSKTPTEIESLKAVQKPNPETPSNNSMEAKESPEKAEPVTKPSKEETKVPSPKHDQRVTSQSHSILISESGNQNANWKSGVAKLNVITTVINGKDDKTEENTNKDIGNAINVTKDVNKEKDKCEEIQDTSVSIEEKTYNVTEKNKKVSEVDKKLVEGNKTGGIVKNDVTEIVNKDVQKVKNEKKKDKTDNAKDNNALEKEPVIRQDSKKTASKEKAAGEKSIHSPKRSFPENMDVELKLNEKISVAANIAKMYKSIEQKRSVARTKTLARAQTEIQTDSTCDEATYTLNQTLEDTSPDNTDFEISSMTDLPEEREPKSPTKCRLSPGEQKHPSTPGDSIASPSTNYSLSEGEIPITSVRRKSTEDKLRTAYVTRSTPPKMEDTLQAITDELARCKRLLFSQKSYDSAITSVAQDENKSIANSSSIQRWASTS